MPAREQRNDGRNPNHDLPKLDLPDPTHFTGERARELHAEMRADYAARSELDRLIDEAARQPVRDAGREGMER